MDRQDFADVEEYGVERWLGELALALREETYRPEPIRRVYIPKANGNLTPGFERGPPGWAVTRRLACNPRLRNAIHYLADAARRSDEKCKAKYLALKARGCSHARALRTIGDRLLYVACTMLKNRTLFDPCFESQKPA